MARATKKSPWFMWHCLRTEHIMYRLNFVSFEYPNLRAFVSQVIYLFVSRTLELSAGFLHRLVQQRVSNDLFELLDRLAVLVKTHH